MAGAVWFQYFIWWHATGEFRYDVSRRAGWRTNIALWSAGGYAVYGNRLRH